MRNYIILNNKNSNTISGLIIQELAPISKPLQRTQVETIDGRDGDIVTPLGYSAYNKKIKIGLYGNFDINEVIAYFATKGTVIFSNEPDKYYYYQIVDQIDYERLVRYRVATVTMHVQPFKYSATEGTITVDASDTVSGEGSDIALDGTAEAPFNTLRHKGNAEQKTLSGKNLFNLDDVAAAAAQTTLTKVANGWRQITTSSGYGAKIQLSGLLPSTTYTLSWTLAVTSGSANKYIRIFKGSAQTEVYAQNTNVQTGKSTLTFTTDAGATQANIWFYNGVPSAGDTTWTYAQLEKSATATDYEPFCGSIPSPSPDYPQDIQVVTGDSTVKITGKNLFNPHDMVKGRTDNGVIGYADGTSVLDATDTTVTFTTTANYRGIVSGLMRVQPSQTYTFSTTVSVATSRYIDAYDMDGNWIRRITGITGVNATFTTPDNCYGIRISLQLTNAGTCVVTNPQFELDGQASSYEQYKAQVYKLNLGKNLFDKDNIPTINNVYVDSTGQVAAGSGNRFTYIKLKPDTTYTITQGKKPSVNIRFALFSDVPALNSAGSLIGSTYSTAPIVLTFTTTKSNYYLGWSYANTEHLGDLTIDEILASIQLEAGSQATDYAVYKTPLELVAIGDYADEPVKVDGTWYIRRAIGKVVFDGSETWATSSYGTNSWALSGKVLFPFDTSKTQIISNIFRGVSNDDRSTSGENIIYSGGANIFVIRNTTLTTLASVQSATSGNYIYYTLATPTDEAITDQDLIDALDELYDQAHSYKGHTHITATAADGNAPAVLSVEVGEDNESTVTNAGNTTSRPILTVYGQGDIGVYINDVEVLDIALGDEEYITLDSIEMEAYKDTTANLKNRLVTGDYSKLALNAGDNKIRFTGTVTKYEISKYSRWL